MQKDQPYKAIVSLRNPSEETVDADRSHSAMGEDRPLRN